MSDTSNFRTTRKGFDPEEVDAAFVELTERIEKSKTAASESESTLRRLKRELSDARSQLRKIDSAPSFSELGSAFEQTLKVAEEQANKLLAQAAAEASEIRDSANAEARELYTSSVAQAEALLTEAQSRSRRAEAQSKSRAAAEVSEAKDGLENARAELARAREDAERIEQDALARVNQINEVVEREAETTAREIATLREVHEREMARIEAEMTANRERSSREITRLDEQAREYVARIEKDSLEQRDESQRREVDVLIKAESLLSRYQVEGDDAVRAAQATADSLVRRSFLRSQSMLVNISKHADRLLESSQDRLTQLERQQKLVQEFASDMQLLREAVEQPEVTDETEEAE
jgi:cell division septum initiation protein DivIVA